MNDQLNFWKALLITPKQFFINEFSDKTKVRFFNTAIVIFCLGYGIDQANRQLTRFDIKGKLDQIAFVNDWIGFWISAVIAGAIGGYIVYLIGGWFYDVRLKWAKGSGNLDLSRRLYLYSNFYLNLTIIFICIVETIKNRKPYDPFEDFQLFDAVSILFLLFFIFHSIYLSFTGVTTLTDVDKKLATVWFAILPTLLYIFLFGALIILFASYFS
ncbi:YIP1 family protein [Hanstruepera marina]|uniref:YIP1 family protein n=1 Tax=Hanstruepera marina TaxID=2873265 RepID=UPI001CA7AE00|nr:YIP1 family protein [Hanstruepera marina]